MKPSSELPRLYVILDFPHARNHGCGDAIEAAYRAASAGARLFQLRDKTVAFEALLAQGERLIEALEPFPDAHILINTHCQIARELDVSGVHTPSSGLVGEPDTQNWWIGASVHDEIELERANTFADFMTISPVFPSISKPEYSAVLGTKRLAELVNQTQLPVFALGGVRPENVSDCLHAGAHGVAVLGSIMGAERPEVVTRAYLDALS